MFVLVILMALRWLMVLTGFAIGESAKIGLPLSALIAVALLSVGDFAVQKGLEE